MDSTIQTVSRRVYSHLNGLAIGSVAQGLLDTGILDRLFEDSKKKICLDTLVTNHSVAPGYTKLALETLCLAGFINIEDEINAPFSVEVTPRGKAWLSFRRLYGQYNELLTPSLEDGAEAYMSNRHMTEISKHIFDNATHGLVQTHLYAAGICLVMLRIIEQGGWDKVLIGKNSFIWLNILTKVGWVSPSGSGGLSMLNKAGQAGLLFAPLYAYPISYFSLLRQIPDLLIDKQSDLPVVDRELDISFSGKVFQGSCRRLFLDQLLPLFDNENIASQPKVIVDTGCGDATVLIETYKAIKNQTIRGQYLHHCPLLLVGVEYEKAAINVARHKLEQENLTHLVIFGEMGKPSELHKTLSEHGIHCRDVLHISKSVIHNRMFSYLNLENASSTQMPRLDMSYVDAKGQSISSHSLFNNLVGFFRLWLPWISHHGMIVIESHCWSRKVSQVAHDHYPMNLVQTTHNFSKQYLVPADFYEAAIKLSGLTTIKTDSISTVAGFPPTMTIKHLKSL